MWCWTGEMIAESECEEDGDLHVSNRTVFLPPSGVLAPRLRLKELLGASVPIQVSYLH